jgi:NOL1/NOP2/sun family putative RNA methylase
MIDRLDDAGISHSDFSWCGFGLKLFTDRPGKMIEHPLGLIHVQEEVSMIPPFVLDPKPCERVLDLCAAPGSKTTQISQHMENSGLVIANEPSISRITSLRSNCERLGVVNVAVTKYDGRAFPSVPGQHFDRVLVDAPCSSEGMARKGPNVLKRSGQKRSVNLQYLQRGILKKAVALTRPGGTVVYSTCTYAPEENESVVEFVLDQVSVEKSSVPGLKSCPGLDEWSGRSYSDELKLCSRYYPHHNDTGGFFVAKLVKQEE